MNCYKPCPVTHNTQHPAEEQDCASDSATDGPAQELVVQLFIPPDQRGKELVGVVQVAWCRRSPPRDETVH